MMNGTTSIVLLVICTLSHTWVTSSAWVIGSRNEPLDDLTAAYVADGGMGQRWNNPASLATELQNVGEDQVCLYKPFFNPKPPFYRMVLLKVFPIKRSALPGSGAKVRMCGQVLDYAIRTVCFKVRQQRGRRSALDAMLRPDYDVPRVRREDIKNYSHFYFNF